MLCLMASQSSSQLFIWTKEIISDKTWQKTLSSHKDPFLWLLLLKHVCYVATKKNAFEVVELNRRIWFVTDIERWLMKQSQEVLNGERM